MTKRTDERGTVLRACTNAPLLRMTVCEIKLAFWDRGAYKIRGSLIY